MFDAARLAAYSEENLVIPPQRSPAQQGLDAMPSPNTHPYDVPVPSGRCYLSEMPSEVLTRIFMKLDGASLTRCFRLCKDLNSFLTASSPLNLHLTLIQNSLLLNPNALSLPANADLKPPTAASLLSTLRERLTKFRNFTPRSTNSVDFKENEGSLYEYLEGVLIRGVEPWLEGRRLVSDKVAVYDLRKLGEWEDEGEVEPGSGGGGGAQGSGSAIGVGVPSGGEGDAVETTESEVGDEIRTLHRFEFQVAEMAVDPGQDLLVIVQVRPLEQERRYAMTIHLLSLTTFQPHPRAKESVLTWPDLVSRNRVSLAFQIADDGLFILKHNGGPGQCDQLHGWQWTTGRQCVVLRARPTESFESFVLISPSSFVIPTINTHLDQTSEVLNDITDASDLSWTHHLCLYAFPPLSALPRNGRRSSSGEVPPPPHTATHVTTIDLPSFHVDILREQPPPRMSIRTDPPPRATFPTHPEGAIAPFAPTQESGVIVIEFHCQTPVEPFPHYVMCLLKSTLAQYLPAPTSPLLSQAFPRPAPVVQWTNLAPYVRMLGPNMAQTSWVCYVYQNRYIIPHDDLENEQTYLRLYDFDPMRVRKEICDRKYSLAPWRARPRSKSTKWLRVPASPEATAATRRPDLDPRDETGGENDGDRDGIVLVTKETVLAPDLLLRDGVRTGAKLPYLYVDKETEADVALIDGERIVAVSVDQAEWHEAPTTTLDVMDF